MSSSQSDKPSVSDEEESTAITLTEETAEVMQSSHGHTTKEKKLVLVDVSESSLTSVAATTTESSHFRWGDLFCKADTLSATPLTITDLSSTSANSTTMASATTKTTLSGSKLLRPDTSDSADSTSLLVYPDIPKLQTEIDAADKHVRFNKSLSFLDVPRKSYANSSMSLRSFSADFSPNSTTKSVFRDSPTLSSAMDIPTSKINDEDINVVSIKK